LPTATTVMRTGDAPRGAGERPLGKR